MFNPIHEPIHKLLNVSYVTRNKILRLNLKSDVQNRVQIKTRK